MWNTQRKQKQNPAKQHQTGTLRAFAGTGPHHAKANSEEQRKYREETLLHKKVKKVADSIFCPTVKAHDGRDVHKGNAADGDPSHNIKGIDPCASLYR